MSSTDSVSLLVRCAQAALYHSATGPVRPAGCVLATLRALFMWVHIYMHGPMVNRSHVAAPGGRLGLVRLEEPSPAGRSHSVCGLRATIAGVEGYLALRHA